MTEVNKNKVRTDEAWRHLYARLDKDSLLVEAGEEVIRRRLFLKWGTVAAAMLAGVICLMSVWWLMPGNDTRNLNLVTQENREKSTLVTTLEDGSIVYLGQESVLQYPEHFATDKREVNLHGEAFFDVAKKHEQTFLIETEKVQIEVLGTAFNVRSNEEVPFSLSVRRGKVKVSLKRGGHSVLVNAGETVTLQAQQLQLSETSKGNESDIYTKNIRFKDESLEDILRVVNAENSALQIQAGSLDLGKRKLTIEFLDNSPDTVAELICWALNLKCTREGDKLILSER
ncbi:FecR family protein [Bacteroides sp. CG01]|uniref:FecR family protein n=1 Tax=Bacteroides sp. CG01 TaxID=3096000 RepID=UPI002AFFEF83|nr:FecR domain-containing protein [Bacteroides sp. CG01]